MPWPTYSERFLHHQAEGWWTFTVPDGMRAVVTSIAVTNYAPPPGIFTLAIGPIVVCAHSFQVLYELFAVETRQVAYQGEDITGYSQHEGIHQTVSGYLLQDDSGRTGPPAAAVGLPYDPHPPGGVVSP